MNDPLRICPRCCELDCKHAERLLANALAGVGTGIMNIDISVSHRWVASLRRHSRTAFVELKQANEPLGMGQRIALLDLTGTLLTESGYRFEQRAFLVRQTEGSVSLSTFSRRHPDGLSPLLNGATWSDVAAVVADWMRTGDLTFDFRSVA